MPKLTEELAGPLRQMQVWMFHLLLTTIGILFNLFLVTISLIVIFILIIIIAIMVIASSTTTTTTIVTVIIISITQGCHYKPGAGDFPRLL